ncbi:hypothetical protein BH10BAC5_BH10BAC5_18670 [soil metagenome]
MKILENLAKIIKQKRKEYKLTQSELAAKSGVGLRFIRSWEQGKTSLNMKKVNQVLMLFGLELGAVPMNTKNL